MSLWDKVKETGKAVKDTAAKGVKTISDEMARQAEEKRLKEGLLSTFWLEDMKGLCKQYGYSGPSPYEVDFDTGRKHKVKLEREDWFKYCMGLSLDKLKKYAERNRRISQDAREVLTEIDEKQREAFSQVDAIYEESQKMSMTENPSTGQTSQVVSVSSDFEEILSAIRTNYEDAIRDQEFNDEDQFNDNLVSYLRAKFGDKHRIENTRKLHRDTGDIFIDGKYVLELKYADNKGTLDTGLQETKRYKEKNYPGVAVIILDVGALTGALSQYKRWYEEDGAKVLILRGKGERKKVKKRYFVREE